MLTLNTLLAAELLPPLVRRSVDAVKLPWLLSPRRFEENSTSTAQGLLGQELTNHEVMDQNHRKGIHRDAITQRKDD